MIFAEPSGRTRPSHYGITLPVPSVKFHLRIAPAWSVRIERFAPLTFEIDSSGRVTGYKPGEKADSMFFGSIDSLLLSLDFTPGKIQRKNSPMLLPSLARSWPKAKHMSFVFPIDEEESISNMSLYEEGIKLNGVNPPRIREFPSYFCGLSPGDTMQIYPYLLAKIGLDRTGKPIIIKLIRSTAGVFTDQLLTAINWGKYEPMMRDGVELASPAYILISLYPEIGYPTKLLDVSSGNFESHRESERVRILIDTLGEIMSPPIPRSTRPLTYRSADGLGVHNDTISGRIRIDTLGHVHIGLISNSSARAKKSCRAITDQLLFYPALDFSGRPKNFSGLIYFQFDETSTFVRISLEWLREDNFSSSTVID